MKKLQNHATLEAEVARLRCLLVDIRGRIEGEIGAFPYQRPVKNIDLVSSVDQGSFLSGTQATNSCDFRCSDQMYCNPRMQLRTMGENGAMSGQMFGQAACDMANIQCMGSAKSGSKLPGCGGMDTVSAGCLPNVEKK
uniref:Uncharacterized protein n=1 Tax=Arundo donax TaxID=35708 RepID=A0A0A9AJE0_ARUDO